MDREQMIATLELHGWQPLSLLRSGIPQLEAVLYHPEHGLVVRGNRPFKPNPGYMPKREPREWFAVPDLAACYSAAMEASYGSAT